MVQNGKDVTIFGDSVIDSYGSMMAALLNMQKDVFTVEGAYRV